MRNSFLFFVACLIPAVASDTLSIEDGCLFWGSRPTHVTHQGLVTIHHNGDFRPVGNLGATSLWEGTGPVWVVWSSPTEVLRHRFRVNGNLQTCVK